MLRPSKHRCKRRKLTFGLPAYKPQAQLFEEEFGESPYILEVDPAVDPPPSSADNEIDVEDRFLPGWELRQKLLKGTQGGWIKKGQKRDQKAPHTVPKRLPHVRALKEMTSRILHVLEIPSHEFGEVVRLFKYVPLADASLKQFLVFANLLTRATLAAVGIKMKTQDLKNTSLLLAKAMQAQSRVFIQEQRQAKLKSQASIQPFTQSYVRSMSLIIKHYASL